MRSRIMLDRRFLSEILRSTTEQSCGELVGSLLLLCCFLFTMRVSSYYAHTVPSHLGTSAPRRMSLGLILDFFP